MGFMIHLKSQSLLFFLGRIHLYICTFNSTEYSDLFRFGVGILAGAGLGKNLRISFGIQAQLKCNIRYIHTLGWIGFGNSQ